MNDVARGRTALQILFFLVAAEVVAKLTAGFNGEGYSRKFVKRFFAEMCSDSHRAQLANAFGGEGSSWTAEAAVDYLYDLGAQAFMKGNTLTFI
jgi:hypothetical protein